MSVASESIQSRWQSNADLKLAVIGAATVLVSVAAFVLSLIGALPAEITTVIVMMGMTIALRVLWRYAVQGATTSSRIRIATTISNAGLAISAIMVIAALPRITQAAGVGLLLVDLLAQLWTLAILTAAAGPARTLGWRAFAGAFLTGFLGLMGLARFIGRPLVLKLGASSLLAVGIWVPLTEELCKMLPVVFLLVMALRRRDVRPSLLDLILVGGWAAAGLAVAENASYGRGGFSLLANPILSAIFPSSLSGAAEGWKVAQAGHLVHTGLIALGVGFAFFYGRRTRRAWWVAAVAIVAALLEHVSQNSISAGALRGVIAQCALALTAGGRLSMILLIGGIIYIAALEWRIVGIRRPLREYVQLEPAEARRRAGLLAAAQTGTPRVTVESRQALP